MKLPKFLLWTTQSFQKTYSVHTEYPRFILNVEEEEAEWLDDLEEMMRKVLRTKLLKL